MIVLIVFTLVSRIHFAFDILPVQSQQIDTNQVFLIIENYLSKKEFDKALQITTALQKELKQPSEKLYRMQGRIYSLLNQQGNAIEVLKKAEKINPNNSETLALLGYSYEQAFDNKKAINYLEKSISINPRNHKAYTRLSVLSMREQKFSDSRRYLNKALNLLNILTKSYPDSMEIVFDLGVGYSIAGEWEEAQKKVIILEENRSPFGKQLQNLVKSLQDQTREDIKRILVRIKQKPKDIQIKKVLGNMYKYIKEYDKALDIFLSIEKTKPKHSEIYESIASIYFHKQLYEKATEYLEKAIQYVDKNSSEFVTIAANLGHSYIRTKRYNEALKKLNRALSVAERIESPPILDVAFAMYGKGIAMLQREYSLQVKLIARPTYYRYYQMILNNFLSIKTPEEIRYSAIISNFKKSISIKPDLAEAYFALGICFSFIHQTSKAIKSFQDAIKYQPNYIDAIIALSQLYISLDEIDLAIKTIEKSLRYKEQTETLYTYLGNLYSRKKNMEKAEKYYTDAISINKKNKNALYKLGTVYAKSRKWESAIIVLKKLKVLDEELHDKLDLYIQEARSGLN